MRIRKDESILAVDPGVGGTGWAFFRAGALHEQGTINAPEGGDWMSRMRLVRQAFDGLLASWPISKAVLEGPQFMSGFGGFTVAVTGDLCKLAMLTGAFLRCLHERQIPAQLATPSQWKGQMSKGATRIRCEQILGKPFAKRTTSHSRDAVGIGLWVLGKF